ncbi:SDR family oxidoreductase [Fructobacillus sp. M2-14]|uniref:SDR family oxidoreductase n=1 Tax=Fructobacillus broussonetiae TaxID=2713173 RepID=A0ABS5QY94_9LACO|nr:SDR family oxidoreductase [Fructobacillus broussonetiae]MBS9338153.1 SDR family oxidoreductase [Fructobacillus broussonetiae]
MLLENKVALVTGGSRGIGASISKKLALAGAFVVVNYLKNEARANELVEEIEADGGRALAIVADVRDEVAVQTMIKQIEQQLGVLHIVVNNAFTPYEFNPKNRKMLADLTWFDYQSQIDGSARALMNVMQAGLPVLKRNASSKVVNLTSDLVNIPATPYHDYVVGKSAVMGLNRSMAVELGAFGIAVNAIAPGLTYPTESSQFTKRDVRDAIIEKTPSQRLTTPEDVAGTALYLVSDLSANVTGQCLFVDGGLHMG